MKARELSLLALLIALLGFAAVTEPRFVTLKTQLLLSSHLWELAIVAVPMLLIIISGGIDLSVGSMLALSAVALGLLFERGMPVFGAAGAAVAAGTLLGAANGWLTTRLKVHPLIVTLATMAAFRGIAEGISLARPISGYPDGFLELSSGKLVGMPFPAIVFTLILILAGFALGKLVLGRWVFAIGHSEQAARFSGIPAGRVKVFLYAFSGFCCGLAAVLMVARNNTAKADLAVGLELEAITAVVLGGASIEGGRGSVLGLLMGLLLIHETREFVTWHWKASELNLIVLGALLIASVLLQKLFSGRSRVASEATV